MILDIEIISMILGLFLMDLGNIFMFNSTNF